MRIEKEGQFIKLPPLTAVIEWDEVCFFSKCPELGVASQGKTKKEAYEMLVEAVGLWLECASPKEIKRQLKHGGAVKPLELANA